MTLIEDIQALPAEERLGAALDVIRMLCGSEGLAATYHLALGLRPGPARLLAALVARRGATASKFALLEAFNGEGCDQQVNVYISILRKRLADLGAPDPAIITQSTFGYSVTPAAIAWLAAVAPERAAPGIVHFRALAAAAPDVAIPPRENRPWAEEESDDLRRMFLRGDHVRAIAYEIGRSERAVLDQVRRLGLRKETGARPWSDRDCDDLRRMFRRGDPVAVIARDLRRSAGAVRDKVRRLGLRLGAGR